MFKEDDKKQTQEPEEQNNVEPATEQTPASAQAQAQTQTQTPASATVPEQTPTPQKAPEDPYAALKKLIFEQKPESREAEIRAQKNRAKATAWLQAFTTLADAFTLHRGGDVVKRDMNPYILNNMQRADALGEQDKADKKAWENSLLNLENNIAQYNARQIELDKSRKFAVEDREAQRKYAVQDREAQEAFKEKQQAQSHADAIDQIWVQGNMENWLKDKDHPRQLEKLGAKASQTAIQQAAKFSYDMQKLNLQQRGRETIATLKAKGDTYMAIPNPNNPSEMIGISESVMLLIFGLALQDKRNYTDPQIDELIKFKPTDYTQDEKKMYVELISQMYQDKLLAYLGVLAPQILGTQPATPTQNTSPTPESSPNFVGPPSPTPAQTPTQTQTQTPTPTPTQQGTTPDTTIEDATNPEDL